MNELITGKLLKARGWPEGKVIGLAKAAGEQLAATGLARDDVLNRLDEVRDRPGDFLGDRLLSDVAREALRRTQVEVARVEDVLRDAPLPFRTWGAEGIDEGASDQMRNALRLPVAVAGALMPDAHIGYGLPIGGVLATQGTVLPYAVGVDIACFTGDTRVPTTDGKEYSLRELAKTGESFVVYACTPSGRIVAARATASKTRSQAELLEVTLDNGEQVRCTPDHPFHAP